MKKIYLIALLIALSTGFRSHGMRQSSRFSGIKTAFSTYFPKIGRILGPLAMMAGVKEGYELAFKSPEWRWFDNAVVVKDAHGQEKPVVNVHGEPIERPTFMGSIDKLFCGWAAFKEGEEVLRATPDYLRNVKNKMMAKMPASAKRLSARFMMLSPHVRLGMGAAAVAGAGWMYWKKRQENIVADEQLDKAVAKA